MELKIGFLSLTFLVTKGSLSPKVSVIDTSAINYFGDKMITNCHQISVTNGDEFRFLFNDKLTLTPKFLVTGQWQIKKTRAPWWCTNRPRARCRQDLNWLGLRQEEAGQGARAWQGGSGPLHGACTHDLLMAAQAHHYLWRMHTFLFFIFKLAIVKMMVIRWLIKFAAEFGGNLVIIKKKKWILVFRFLPPKNGGCLMIN